MSSQENETRILLVENHLEVSKRIATRLGHEEDMRVCATATQQTVLAQAKICQPDVILIDPYDQGELNFEVIKSLKDTVPDSRLIVLTIIVDTVSQLALRKMGIEQILEKDLNSQKLIDIIRDH